MPEKAAQAGRLVHAAAFAEPGLLRAGDRWWAYAATGPAGTVPALSSIDLLHWEREPDVLPSPGAWALPGRVRAPEVVAGNDGRWWLYYGATCAAHGVPAVGLAAATDPGGPFRDSSPEPLLCEPALGGATDPAVLIRRDGTRWLTWAAGNEQEIRTRRLTGDGLLAAAPTTVILRTSLPWQGNVVRAPQLIETGDGVLLLYSAGSADTPGSRLAAARSPAPDVPFVPDPQSLLGSGPAFDGPGHAGAARDENGQWWLLFAAWETGHAGVPGAQQRLWLAALETDGPRIREPVPPPTPLPSPPGTWRLPIPADPSVEQEAVLRAFTVHGRIRALPARYGRRVVLLDLLAQIFEPGLRYPESEVDRRLTAIWAPGAHPDYARLRRLLVDHGFLDRRGGVYRRSGGTV